MRRIIPLIFAIAVLLTLALGVNAANSATHVNTVASVGSDESCNVTMTVTIHLDQPKEKLTFPVPKEATAVTLNGNRAATTQADGVKQINLSQIAGQVAGDFTFTITYQLNDVVSANEDGLLLLNVPLLSGFDYSVADFDFTVTLPGEITGKPAFTSGYHHSNIEQYLSVHTEGASVTGSSTKELKDRETLTMTLNVTEQMFPQSVIALQDYSLLYTLMIAGAVLALLYWLLFLRCGLPRFPVSSAPADGYTAGQVASITQLQGADLTMMVFTWAQLGYVLIKLDKRGHVTLHKRMDMGNERSGFEQKCFKLLFGKRNQVDPSGYHYAAQWEKVAKLSPNIRPLMHPRSGSMFVFRLLAASIGLLGGICLGMALGAEAAARGFIIFLMALFGALSSWHIQKWANDLFRLGKTRLITALLLCVLWIVLICVSGQFAILIWVVVGQLLAGLMASFGGRRTEAGRQVRNQTFGLYRYMRSLKQRDLIYICRQNPEYFHTLAPYALAMGVDLVFAKRFGRMKLPECPYLITPTNTGLSAAQWSKRMRAAVNAMNARRRQMPLEKFMNILQVVRR